MLRAFRLACFTVPRATVFVASWLVVAGCSAGDTSVKVFDGEPLAEILSPEHESVLPPGTPITMQGTASDLETASESLLATWLVDGSVVCDSVSPAPAGLTECVTEFDPGSYTIELVVTDGSGQTNTASASVYVEAVNAPVVEISEPFVGGVYYADRATTLSGAVSDVEDNPESLSVSWTSSVQGDLGVSGSPSASGLTTGEATLDAGQHEITLTAVDSDGLSGTDSVVITVIAENTPPDCSIIAPTDGSYNDAGAAVAFEGEGEDSDVTPDRLRGEWRSDRDGELFADALSSSGISTFTTDALTVGTHVITFTVTDDADDSCSRSITYTVGSPPVVEITLPGDGDLVTAGDLVSFEGLVTDSEDVGVDLDVEWTSDIDGALDSSPPPGDGTGVVGFISDELSAGTHTIRLRGTDSDGLYADDSISFTVNGPPSTPVISIAPDPAVTTDALAVSIDVDSIDPEGVTVTYGYDWTVDGLPSGVTTASVASSATTRGQRWEVTVTPFDGLAVGSAAVASVIIDNSPPEVVTAPTLGPDPAYEGDTLTCTSGTTDDADGDSVVSSISWMVNGAAVSATASSIGSTFFNAGDTVYCLQTPDDGIDIGTGVASNTVTIANTPPEVSDVAITPEPATAADILTCSYSYSDADTDPDASTVAWSIGSTSAGTGTTLSGGYVRGDTVTCEVTANDGTDAGNTASASIIIENSPPEVLTVEVTPDPSQTSDDYTCTVTAYSDADGDSVTYSYAWYVNGSSVGVSADTLDAGYHVKNDTVFCRVYADDGYDVGDSEDSNIVTTGNTAPEIDSVTLSPASPGTDDEIEATVVTSDADPADSVSVTYDWYVNSALTVSGGSSTLASSYYVRGNTVYVVVTPSDGTDTGTSLSSSSVTIQNTLPEAPVLTMDPAAPEQEIDDLFCEVTTDSYDADSDLVTYTFEWTVDGAAFSGASTTDHPGDTVDAADTVLGFDWICTATPNDGYGDGAQESILVTVRDVTDPDAPTVDTPDRFRNDDMLTLTGTCDYGDCVDVEVTCLSTSQTLSASTSCGSGDAWTTSFTGLTRDETTLCNAYCVDSAGNDSSDSNTVSTDVCEPYDAYEDASGTGDTDGSAVDPWSAIAEGGSGTISANILQSDTVDWYVIDSDDNVVVDRTAGWDYYSLDIRLLDYDTGSESSDYTMTVYKGSVSSAECASSGGFTAYTDYWYDRGDGSHSPPADRRRCGVGASFLNDCEDMSQTYYVKVERVSSSITSCAGYTVSVTNNGGVCDTSTECPY